MAKYNLNEELKAREAAKGRSTQNGEVHLDDVSRVKVLSPGRKVFKRFIRNRLAVFGSILLITMFVFSFIGPLFYAYGQKQIFYKYDKQNVNYALAKENTAYNGYSLDDSVTLDRTIVNAMNSNIKKMIAADRDKLDGIEDEMGFEINKLADEIYTLSAADAELVASVGDRVSEVGTYDGVRKEIVFKYQPIEGLNEAVQGKLKGSGGEFVFDGVTYTYKKTVGKNYAISAEQSGLAYVGSPIGGSFERALDAATQTGDGFSADGQDYMLVKIGDAYDVYRVSNVRPALIYTRLRLDTFETGLSVPDAFKAAALLAVSGDGAFSFEGRDFTIADEDGILIVRDDAGQEFAEFSTFVVRRYNGDDTMDYDLKKAVAEAVEEMAAMGRKESSLVYNLPMQNEDGSYATDEDGNLLYNETEMVITQRDTGEYVLRADQINYIIDMFASPSGKHLLGTDGDGFDVLARIMYGGRVSLMVGFVVVFLEIFLGIIMGGLAGYYGGWVDNLIMRLVDIFYCLPSMPIMIILGAMMDAMRMASYKRLVVMMAALGIMGWAGVARLVRGQILSLREQEFMVATEATGIKVSARIFRHLVPNVMPQLIVTATMGMGSIIITESTLSFLGLGVKHPLATWGTIINSVSSASAMAHYAFIWIPVGLLICLTVIAFNFVGDGLRDAYDPRAKR